EGTSSGKGADIPVNTGQWTHIAVSFEQSAGPSGTAAFYINGEEAGSGSGNIAPISVNSVIGSLSNGNSRFNGSIDELKIWNTVRTPQQIREGMTATVNGSSPGLLLYYDFDQGIAGGSNPALNRVYDRSANAYQGSLNNFALSGSTANWAESYAMVIPEALDASDADTACFTYTW